MSLGIALEHFLERCKDKYVPLVTSAGIFSVTVEENKEAKNADMSIGVQKFNSANDKNWTDNLQNGKVVRLKVLLPLHCSIIKNWEMTTNPRYIACESALAARFAEFSKAPQESYELAFVNCLHP